MNTRVLLLPALALAALSVESLLEGYTLNNHKWGTTTVSYYVNPQNKWVSQNAAISAIQMAATAWRDQSSANISLAYAGSTNGSSCR